MRGRIDLGGEAYLSALFLPASPWQVLELGAYFGAGTVATALALKETWRAYDHPELRTQDIIKHLWANIGRIWR
jgi:hypothetical protein